MKLISLNVEGKEHPHRILPFLKVEKADIVCLQEGTRDYVEVLEGLGYNVSFLPRCIREHNGEDFIDGLILASLHPITFEAFHYYDPFTEIMREEYDELLERNNTPRSILMGSILYEGQTYVIGTTHFTWTQDGSAPCVAQETDMLAFTKLVQSLPPHVICGDFNIPRNYNKLYEHLISFYEDAIPHAHKTSLDSELHRLKHDEVKYVLLEKYMVDYVFSQLPYKVSDVRMQFALSDHAAVIATISK